MMMAVRRTRPPPRICIESSPADGAIRGALICERNFGSVKRAPLCNSNRFEFEGYDLYPFEGAPPSSSWGAVGGGGADLKF